MRLLPAALGTLALLTAPALAQDDDPVAARIALMHANGGAAALAGGMLKNEIEYSVPAGRAALLTFDAIGRTFGGYFPEGSDDPERSRAAPAIWEDWEGFQSALDEFSSAAAAAVEAAGEEGPADLEAFQQAAQPVMETCRGCHEDYRLEEN